MNKFACEGDVELVEGGRRAMLSLRLRGPNMENVGVSMEKPPTGVQIKTAIDAGEWPASADKKNKTMKQLTVHVNAIQRSLFSPPYGQRGSWSQEAQRRLLDWLISDNARTQRQALAEEERPALALEDAPRAHAEGGDSPDEAQPRRDAPTDSEVDDDTESSSSSASVASEVLELQGDVQRLEEENDQLKQELQDVRDRLETVETDAQIWATENELLKLELQEHKRRRV